MSRRSTLLASVAGPVLAVGLLLAYVQRDSDPATASLVVLGVGTVLAVLAAVVGVIEGRNPPGLRRPDGVEASWPVAPWWWVVGSSGAVDVLAGPLVSGWLGAVGVVLVGVSLIALGRDLIAPAPPLDRGTVRAALRLRDAADGDAEVGAAVARVGAIAARVVVFDGTGRLGDVVVRDTATGELAARLAGLPLVAPSELHPPLRTG